MSLYGALFSGVSGLAAQSSAMGAISDNITNVNTIGYKGTQVNFQTLVTKNPGLTEYSPGGVMSKPRTSVDTQGLLQATNSSTDVAIAGSGMFVVNTNPDPATSGTGEFRYTRAGSFKVDKQGYLQNVSGFYVQGWPLMPTDNSTAAKATEVVIDGNTYMRAYSVAGQSTPNYVNMNIIDPDNMKGLNLKTIGGTADPTTEIKIGANLPAGDSVYSPTTNGSTGIHQTSVLIYDSLGDTHNFDVNWMKTNSNTWNIQQKDNIYNVSAALGTTASFTAVAAAAGLTIDDSAAAAWAPTGTVDFNATAGTITFGAAADALKLPVGTVFTVGGTAASTNAGSYIVKSNAAGVVTIDTAPYQVQRGINPPQGAAALALYDTSSVTSATSPGKVYASQGRLDFTQTTDAAPPPSPTTPPAPWCRAPPPTPSTSTSRGRSAPAPAPPAASPPPPPTPWATRAAT